jgi:hypothetical protein
MENKLRKYETADRVFAQHLGLLIRHSALFDIQLTTKSAQIMIIRLLFTLM